MQSRVTHNGTFSSASSLRPCETVVELPTMFPALLTHHWGGNHCIDVAWPGGNELVALLRCSGSPGCFDSGLQLVCIVGSGVSRRFSMGFGSDESAGQSSTVTPRWKHEVL
ncbi:hypothetical protein AMELA_G00096430 [Ameiurus melas]|uniref:Uncharacterized protein n=1 Tax=Ameiurus melas TaxID=219545 RepID=A0A7J6ATR2_AMEME|nr:hypothetical protein AMELA_G00096430 [Ameiurus melas]